MRKEITEVVHRKEERKHACSRCLRYSVSESEEPGLNANRTRTLSNKLEGMYDVHTFGLGRRSLLPCGRLTTTATITAAVVIVEIHKTLAVEKAGGLLRNDLEPGIRRAVSARETLCWGC